MIRRFFGNSGVSGDRPMGRLASPGGVGVAVIAALLMAAVLPGSAVAQHDKKMPQALKKGVGIEPNPGVELPGDVSFTNAAGEEVKLGDYFKGDKPVLFTLAYYSCPMLCKYIREGLVKAQEGMDWTAGQEFRVVVLSFNHREDTELASKSKADDLKSLGRPEAGDGWAYLTGSEANIKKVADTVGFNYKWVEDRQMYAHEATLMVATPDGRVSRYINGIQYQPKTVRLSLVEASDGKIGTVMDQVQLFCFSYDPDKGEYTKDAIKILRAGGLLTMVALAGTIGAFMWWPRRKKRNPEQTSSDEPTTAP